MIDLAKFIDEGVIAQQNFAECCDGEVGPLDYITNKERYAKMIQHFGHLQEEVIEARVYCKRRPWKKNEEGFLEKVELRDEFIAEMFDILLFFRAILAYADISGKEFEEVALQKMIYNNVRPDHLTNQKKELLGICDSAKFKTLCENPDEELTGRSFEELESL